MGSPPSYPLFSSWYWSTENVISSWQLLVVWIVFLLIVSIILNCKNGVQPPMELTLETHENSHPQDIETGHLTPPLPLPLPLPQPQPQPQQDMRTWINQLSIETTIIEFKDIKEEGFDEICCPICLEEFKDGQEIICINKCRHVFHPFCIDSWLKQNRSCPNCRCSLNARNRKQRG